MINNINFFRLLGVLSVGSVYLPIVFFRLPSPFHTPTFYLVVWVIGILLSFPRFFFRNEQFFPVLLLFLIYFFGFFIFWGDRKSEYNFVAVDFNYVKNEVIWLFYSVLMISYYRKYDLKGLKFISVLSVFFITITAITSIIGFELYPSAARLMAASTETEMIELFKSTGIGTYGFFTAIMIILPGLVYQVKHSNLNFFWKATISLSILISFYSVVKSEVTTILVLSGAGILLSLMGLKKYRVSFFFLIAIIAILLIFFQQNIANFFYMISDLFPESILERRLADLGKVFELTEVRPGDNQTYTTGVRLQLSMVSFNSFLQNPLWGGGDYGGHAFWLDRLGLFGIIGFFPWIYQFRLQGKINKKHVGESFFVYYLISLMVYILYGMLKGGCGTAQDFIAIFVVLPGVYTISNDRY